MSGIGTRAATIVLFVACAPATAPEPPPDPCATDAGSPPAIFGGVCRCDAECPDDEGGAARFCDVTTGFCADERRECAAQHECCPGQVCSHGVFCLDRADPCTPEGTCARPGQRCRPLGNGQSSLPGCVLDECRNDGLCPDGLTCFNRMCVGETPCARGCGPQGVCETATNRCFDIGSASESESRWAPSCRSACGQGSVRVFTASMNLFNRCARTLVECSCLPLPVFGE